MPLYTGAYRRFHPPFYVFEGSVDFFSRNLIGEQFDPWHNDMVIEAPSGFTGEPSGVTGELTGSPEMVTTYGGDAAALVDTQVEGGHVSDENDNGDAVTAETSISILQSTFADACSIIEMEHEDGVYSGLDQYTSFYNSHEKTRKHGETEPREGAREYTMSASGKYSGGTRVGMSSGSPYRRVSPTKSPM
ncbi:hypothetical protein R1sor_000033 [Riccia sorocarpa]|uniref:Uncharacterized protein n=1 Tax=Riccia sorocarpa TaxID=122646 RepID=A0ABD3GTL6_9MARC